MKRKFAYFGTPYVAKDTLEYLVSHGYVPEVVVTSPDAPQGRGMVMTPCITKQWAQEQGLPVLTPTKLDQEAREAIASYGCEYAIVVAYGKILPQSLLDMFPKGLINIHYSLLPKYRGASPVEAALLHGDTVTGVSIQRMVYEMDAGDVLAVREVAIEDTDTTKELRPKLITAGAKLLVEILPSFEDGTITATPQDPNQVTRAMKIPKSDGEITLGTNNEENWRKYKAFAESPGTYFFHAKDGERIRVKIKTATFKNGVFTPLRVVPEGKKETDYTAI